MTKNKEVVVITGATGGIGEAIARRMATEDRTLVLTYRRRSEKAEALVDEVMSSGLQAVARELDVTSSPSVDEAAEAIFDDFGRIDVLVNNAGITADSPALGMDERTWNKVIDANLTGLFNCCRAFGKYMFMKRRGRIINISSVVAQAGGRGQANYAAAKGGVESLTRALAIDFAPRNILVNAVAPGVIETGMTAEVREKYLDKVLTRILLGRVGKPSEVAGLVEFLAGEESTYITGQIFRVDGGMLLNF